MVWVPIDILQPHTIVSDYIRVQFCPAGDSAECSAGAEEAEISLKLAQVVI